MKFSIIITFIIFLFDFLSAKFNIRRHHEDPSYNPIQSHWVSQPRMDLPLYHSRKYINHNKAILTHSAYHDNTRALQRRVLHRKK